MKKIPILLSTPMVQSTLADRKTNTRRTLGLDKVNKYPNDWLLDGVQLMGSFIFHNKRTKEEFWIKSPFGMPGDLLWVRETWADVTNAFVTGTDVDIENIAFKADSSVYNCIEKLHYLEQLGENGIYVKKWKPSIHMPKAAARIWLKVTDIICERLQDISEEDAIVEGVEIYKDGNSYKIPIKHQIEFYRTNKKDSTDAFRVLWININGSDSWNANPWVWVIKFEVVSKTGKPNL